MYFYEFRSAKRCLHCHVFLRNLKNWADIGLFLHGFLRDFFESLNSNGLITMFSNIYEYFL